MDIDRQLFLKWVKGFANHIGKAPLFALATLILFSCGQFEKKPRAALNSGSDFEKTLSVNGLFEDLMGNPILMSDYKGKKILLNFWATWCKPCVAEMPALSRAKHILEKENYVFLLASDESPDTIKVFKENHDFELDFIRFTGALSQLKIYALPKTFIYNEDGEKVDEISGTVAWDSDKIIDELKNIQ